MRKFWLGFPVAAIVIRVAGVLYSLLRSLKGGEEMRWPLPLSGSGPTFRYDSRPSRRWCVAAPQVGDAPRSGRGFPAGILFRWRKVVLSVSCSATVTTRCDPPVMSMTYRFSAFTLTGKIPAGTGAAR